jgi:Kef-type K+ transport system membrane component KefB
MNHGEIYNLLLQLCVLLLAGRFFGEGARKFGFPPLVGEIMAGIILGQTIMGQISPDLFNWLFPTEGDSSLILNGFIHVSVVLLLFIAGLEVELSIVVQLRKQAFYTSFFGLIIPFILGFTVVFVFPSVFDFGQAQNKYIFAAFMGASMSITALPVIARILLDINMMRSKIGLVIISSAMINDFIGWIIFTFILSLINGGGTDLNIFETIGLTLGFALFMLTIGKGLLGKILPWINKHLAWPGGVITFTLSICFLGAAITEKIGIHAIFGAFIVGVALGDSIHFSDKAKEVVHHFINNIFSPLFFVSIGLQINFFANFDFYLVIIVLAVAFVGKIVGAGFGSKLGGYSSKESLAIGFGMNARGAMEIILGMVALEVELIDERLFVALVIMAIVTSITSGPFMKYFLRTDSVSESPLRKIV